MKTMRILEITLRKIVSQRGAAVRYKRAIEEDRDPDGL